MSSITEIVNSSDIGFKQNMLGRFMFDFGTEFIKNMWAHDTVAQLQYVKHIYLTLHEEARKDIAHYCSPKIILEKERKLTVENHKQLRQDLTKDIEPHVEVKIAKDRAYIKVYGYCSVDLTYMFASLGSQRDNWLFIKDCSDIHLITYNLIKFVDNYRVKKEYFRWEDDRVRNDILNYMFEYRRGLVSQQSLGVLMLENFRTDARLAVKKITVMN